MQALNVKDSISMNLKAIYFSNTKNLYKMEESATTSNNIAILLLWSRIVACFLAILISICIYFCIWTRIKILFKLRKYRFSIISYKVNNFLLRFWIIFILLLRITHFKFNLMLSYYSKWIIILQNIHWCVYRKCVLGNHCN